MVMENLKDYARAAELLGSVPTLVEQRPESLSALARAYYKIGKKEEARETLEALQKHPAGAAAVFMGGQIAAQADDYEVAEKMLVSIQSTYPNTTLLGYNIALVQYDAGRFREAQETLLGLAQAGNASSEIYNLLGWCYQKQDKPEEARRRLEQAIERDPTRESNYLDLGMILTSYRLFPAALDVAKRNLERHPRSYHAHVMKAAVELKMDQYTDAVASYARAVELDPSNPEPHRGLAIAQFAAGMIEEAKITFESGLKRFPQDAFQYQEYAKVLFKLAEDGDSNAEGRAAELMKSALKLDRSLSEPHYYLGNQALQKRNLKEAMYHLEAGAGLNPNSSKFHYALARVYRRLGRVQEAAKEVERYHKLKAAEEKSVPGISAVVMKN
jgi:tetratricopeptide (TPR) repeat protein